MVMNIHLCIYTHIYTCIYTHLYIRVYRKSIMAAQDWLSRLFAQQNFPKNVLLSERSEPHSNEYH